MEQRTRRKERDEKSGLTLLTEAAGLEISENIQLQFCDKIRKCSCNLAKFSRKIVALHCVDSGVAKQNTSPQYLYWKKPLKMANDIEGMELCTYM